MNRKRRGVALAMGQRHCIFCGGLGLASTPVWPEWLNKLVAAPAQPLEIERPKNWPYRGKRRIRQRSPFSNHSELACKTCVNGWMTQLQDQVEEFSQPLFTSASTQMQLTPAEQRALGAWVALMTILAEYADKPSAVIPQRDRSYLMKFQIPPPEWSIFCASLAARIWYAKYRHRTVHAGLYFDEIELWSSKTRYNKPNCQLTSLGMGELFFQVFTSPYAQLVAEYRRLCLEIELSQVWPIRRSLFGKKSLRFPPKVRLSDETAAELADAYADRVVAMASGG
jgi:hypothetical protein